MCVVLVCFVLPLRNSSDLANMDLSGCFAARLVMAAKKGCCILSGFMNQSEVESVESCQAQNLLMYEMDGCITSISPGSPARVSPGLSGVAPVNRNRQLSACPRDFFALDCTAINWWPKANPNWHMNSKAT